MAGIDSVSAFERWLSPMAAKDWMVNVQPPPPGGGGPSAALGYLGRYVAGTCIGDSRILRDDGTHVTIRVKNYRQEGREEPLTIPGVEFVRRFTLHILPRGFRRIRHAGILTQRKRAHYLAICRELLKDRMPKVPERLQQTKNPKNPDHIPAGDTSSRETDRDWKDRAGKDKYEPDEQPDPPRRCPRCLGSDFEFIECYWPDRASQRPLRCFQARPP